MVHVYAVGDARVGRVDAAGNVSMTRWCGRNAKGDALPDGEDVPDHFHIHRSIRNGALSLTPPVPAVASASPAAHPVAGKRGAPVPPADASPAVPIPSDAPEARTR